MRFPLLWCVGIILVSLDVGTAQNATNVDAKVKELIARERIELGNNTKKKNVHTGLVSLEAMQKITGQKMTQQSFEAPDRSGVMFKWADTKEPAEIGIVFLNSEKRAREWAIFMLISMEDGRTQKNIDIQINNPRLGDLSIRPKKWDKDPHGFDTRNTDKSFVIFVRGCTLVVVDSKRNLNPVIPVMEIAAKIDQLLARNEPANK